MVIDTKQKELFYGWFVKRRFKITKSEIKVLKYLSDENRHTAQEIAHNCDIVSAQAARATICRLKKKGVDIDGRYSMGYVLKSKIRFNGED